MPSPPPIPTVSYCALGPQARLTEQRVWVPGSLGPYGPGPNRPAELNVADSSSTAIGATLLLVIGFVVLGTPIAVIAGVVMLVRRRRGNGWSTAASRPELPPPAQNSGAVRKSLAAIRTTDPHFSVAIFEDFAYALYAEVHTARGRNALAPWAPYLSQAARQTLLALGAAPVSSVVVGAMSYVAFRSNATQLEVTLEYESCYTEGPKSYYVREHWRLVRSRTARSRTPDNARVFHCPNCGAPLDRMLGGTCGYCNTTVDGGAFDWFVQTFESLERDEVPPVLTGSAEEVGTDFPTVFAPDLAARMQELLSRDPSFDQNNLFARIAMIFATMQTAWSSWNWEQARPFLSDGLFETNAYWISAYRAQGLRNITERTRITAIELVRVDSDVWYNAVTVRVHAVGLDYTIREHDRAIVGGNRNKERAYTEYWTLIRGIGRKGPSRVDAGCPNCGSPLTQSMAARCGHCGVKVNSGAFDWVLSKIEQDEVYGG